jgi:acyl-CoA hydrolase
MGKKDLGVHTEMINDCIMKLCLAGVVTGRVRPLPPAARRPCPCP